MDGGLKLSPYSWPGLTQCHVKLEDPKLFKNNTVFLNIISHNITSYIISYMF